VGQGAVEKLEAPVVADVAHRRSKPEKLQGGQIDVEIVVKVSFDSLEESLPLLNLCNGLVLVCLLHVLGNTKKGTRHRFGHLCLKFRCQDKTCLFQSDRTDSAGMVMVS